MFAVKETTQSMYKKYQPFMKDNEKMVTKNDNDDTKGAYEIEAKKVSPMKRKRKQNAQQLKPTLKMNHIPIPIS